ncbi:MAG TPA: hypothetical protein VFX49_23205, partial [Chloroflexota bacterium]|nr:hypothetical protein [Chloroflexota bacterium]
MPAEREWLRRLAILQGILGIGFCLSLKFPVLGSVTQPTGIALAVVALCTALIWRPLTQKGETKRALKMLVDAAGVDLAGAAPLAEPDLRAAASMLGVDS